MREGRYLQEECMPSSKRQRMEWGQPSEREQASAKSRQAVRCLAGPECAMLLIPPREEPSPTRNPRVGLGIKSLSTRCADALNSRHTCSGSGFPSARPSPPFLRRAWLRCALRRCSRWPGRPGKWNMGALRAKNVF